MVNAVDSSEEMEQVVSPGVQQHLSEARHLKGGNELHDTLVGPSPLRQELQSKGSVVFARPDDIEEEQEDGQELGPRMSASTEPSSSAMPIKRPAMMRRGTTATGKGWNTLKTKLHILTLAKPLPTDRAALKEGLTGHQITTELSMGVLSTVILRLGMDVDEHGGKRIPILMNFLKIKITDSLYPLHDSHAVFRIELEYGDGLLRWVVYRELKDFFKLHTHYRVASFRHGIDKVPTFPKTTLPYLHWLNSNHKAAQVEGEVSKIEFAQKQREALERYMQKLIRATMFGRGANRLCKFLEISALSIALSTKGGELGKQGYLRITSSGASRKSGSGFHPFTFKKRHEPKWFVVRESYIAAVEDPSSEKIYDCILFDGSFAIERPKRFYRQGLSFLTSKKNDDDESEFSSDVGVEERNEARREKARMGAVAPKGHHGAGDPADPSTTDLAVRDPEKLRDGGSNHSFYLVNSERRLRLVAKTERQQDQFIASIEKAVASSIWGGKNRFDSFAPIRLNSTAQWLVDGRDYFYALSRAIRMAKETIYIHDWWLSPELYLRRPPAENEQWRLDRMLKQKAEEGVQISVILYREVSNEFTPVDSTYTKNILRGLHPNIHVQRSPSHTSTGTLLWSHHEKMVVIDNVALFTGGLDLCYGRWDTPGHSLIDDEPDNHIWPGVDYANSRVKDFENLHTPFVDLFDRGKVPRQPWHDIGFQSLGQVARDYARHFITRWNMLLRTKNHTVEMPFLIPAPDFTTKQLSDLGIVGTCEIQALRSASPWSLGIDHVEHSIQNAYIKAIELSEHFLYIENQFFISSTTVEGTTIENNIGNAIVSRIIKAHTEGTVWKAIIVLPLMPGYPFPLDHADAGSVRLIMECQNQTIARGEDSMFARLRREGIDPVDYLCFSSLRGWGKLANGSLTTEGVYVHAKCMIVDDRICIIGSANINERSQTGSRDSELASIIRDTDMLDSTMGGKPFKVGKFAHTLRIRLMQEHLGIDVDALEAEELEKAEKPKEASEPVDITHEDDAWDPDHDQERGADTDVVRKGKAFGWIHRVGESAATNAGNVVYGATQVAGAALLKAVPRIHVDKLGQKPESPGERIVEGEEEMSGFASTVVPTLEERAMVREDKKQTGEVSVDENDGRDTLGATTTLHEPDVDDTRKLRMQSDKVGVESDSGDKIKPLAPTTVQSGDSPPRIVDSAAPPDIGTNTAPPSDGDSSAINSGEDADSLSPLARSRSGANEVAANQNSITTALHRNLKSKTNAYTVPLPSSQIDPHGFKDPLTDHFYKDVWLATSVRNTQCFRKVFRCLPDDLVKTWAQYTSFSEWTERHNKAPTGAVPAGDKPPYHSKNSGSAEGAGGGGAGGGVMGQGMQDPPLDETMATSRNRSSSFGSFNRRGTSTSESSAGNGGEKHEHTDGFPEEERAQMEECLNSVQGHLVIYPTRFLEAEAGNFLFPKDRISPIAIYN